MISNLAIVVFGIHHRLPEYSPSKSVDRLFKCVRVVEVPRLIEYASEEWYRHDATSTVNVSLYELPRQRITEYTV